MNKKISNKTKTLILACSLNTQSKSYKLADYTYKYLLKNDKNAELIDLRNIQLPLCDGGGCYKDPKTWELQEKINQASVILFAVPVYNYGMNATAKNVIDLAGTGLLNKTIGFIAASGGEGSYMSLLPTMNTMMLQYRAIVIPRFVYASSKKFDENGDINDKEIKKRLEDLANQSIEIAKVTFPIMSNYEDKR